MNENVVIYAFSSCIQMDTLVGLLYNFRYTGFLAFCIRSQQNQWKAGFM